MRPLGGVIGDRVAQFGIFIVSEQEVAVGPAALAGARVGVQGPADDQAFAGDGVDAEQVAVGQGAAGLPGLDGAVVAGGDDQVAGAGFGAVGDGDRGAVLDDAEGNEFIADAAVELAAQRVVGGHQQGVGAVGGQRDVGGCGGVHHLLRFPAADPGVLVVLGQHGGVAVAQPQAGLLFPGGAEPDGFGEPGVAQGAGEQGHAAAVFYCLQLAGVSGQDDLGAAGLGVGDQVGQVRAGDHRSLIDDQQRAGSDGEGATGAAAARQVAQELRAVVGHRDPGGQGVAGRLGRGDPDHRAQAGFRPGAGGLGQDPRFAGPGGGVDNGYALAVGQDTQRGGGLVLTQAGARALVLRVFGRVTGERVFELREVRAERAGGLRAGQARRVARAGLGEHAFFHGQLRAGGVPHAAVPLVDAAPVGAQQAGWRLGRLGCLHAQDRLELAAQGAVGEAFEQRSGRGRVLSGAGQGPGPGT